jgi:TRAP-type C4-dicarboxylate transport system substrate-binding protein
MRKTKMGTSDIEMNLLNVFKSMWYQLVPESSDHILIDLNTGRVESLYQSPLSAASFQLFTVANNMMDFPIAPFMGGIVMNQTAWRQLPQNQRDIILKHAKVAETEIDSELINLEKNALDMMKKNGLKVYKLTPAEEEIWIKDTEAAIPRLLGTTFDAGIYNQITAFLKEFRR